MWSPVIYINITIIINNCLVVKSKKSTLLDRTLYYTYVTDKVIIEYCYMIPVFCIHP